MVLFTFYSSRHIACVTRCKSGDVWQGVLLSERWLEGGWQLPVKLSRAEMKTARDEREKDIFLVQAKVQLVSAHG